MKVVVDNKIPFIKEAIERIADEVVYAAGKDFTPALIKDADALIIRTRTQCNKELLENSKVSFIATATIGFDHIDTDYCLKAGISWTNAPGCNASSVAQYVQSTLLLLQQVKGFDLKNLTLGVIGVGNVGSKIVELGHRLGMRVLSCDTPRADKEGKALFYPLESLAEQCDILSFHVPLSKEGIYKTYHMANELFFNSLKKSPIIINTSRGEVVHTKALIQALNRGLVSDAVIDVWENEPTINLSLLKKVFLGTPHIAGYSADGKSNATKMALDALCHHFHLKNTYLIEPPLPANRCITSTTPTDAALQMYDPRRDSEILKSHPERFEQLRGDYPLRRERKAYILPPMPFPLF
ncbi:erythronate-4-phosphate dehydrogenase [gut metagenome]|uniref:Erythronate-4-phosphate dehydrogenase n=1 Tax=gut metagenome TaxID=749906 RepID=J9FI36_9ZZZZ